MTHRFAEIAFTDSVQAAQEEYGSRTHNERYTAVAGPNDALGAKEIDFIAERDTFYLATVSETGWPYVQHRGGPAGFLKVIDQNTIAYPDFRGNTQLISAGNARQNDRCSLILMDYPRRRRLKILGHMQVKDAHTADPELVEQLELPDYKAKIERVVLIDVTAFDWNCPQHITRRYTEAEMALLVEGDGRDHGARRAIA
jgi:predicted pyridoxine 5'-phosphate oxidase superfamily flavin-nucleotide-binding protein